MVSTGECRGALVWGSWRVSRVDLDGCAVLCVMNGSQLVGHCATPQEAIDLLARFGVPIDMLTREQHA